MPGKPAALPCLPYSHPNKAQDCIEYADYPKHNNEPVDGFIMQGPVSDRETLDLIMPNPQPSLDMAVRMISEGKGGDCMPFDMIPAVLGAPISAYRFQSLASKGYIGQLSK